jgi:nicotinamide mononucleotide transporter
MSIFSVDNIAFSVLGYPMSYIEFVGTVLYLWSVWLITRRRVLTWPVGIVSVLLYMSLFYQIRLYSDSLEQIYYLAACTYGWWRWVHSPKENGRVVDVRFSTSRGIVLAIAVTLVLFLADGYFMSWVHTIFPKIFPEQASFPYLDALTTIMSFTAMWLMAQKRIESWVYWIIVDVIGIGLYYVKEVKFVSLLYVFLLILATKGFVSWIRVARSPQDTSTHEQRP